MADEFIFVDLNKERRSKEIELAFPDWRPGDERVLIISPHDDDAILGAGVVWQAVQANGGEVLVAIVCDGSAGYSTPEEKDTIVETRRAETVKAYGALGLGQSAVTRFDVPDFSGLPYVGYRLPGGVIGTFGQSMPLMRQRKITRLVVPNGYREHIDHEAAFRIGAYDGPQVGDRVIAEWGWSEPVRSLLQYAVWGDFDPEDAVITGRPTNLRGDLLVLCNDAVTERINRALRQWASQQLIIEGLLAARAERSLGPWFMEAYLRFDPRPTLKYGPYRKLAAQLLGVAEA